RTVRLRPGRATAGDRRQSARRRDIRRRQAIRDGDRRPRLVFAPESLRGGDCALRPDLSRPYSPFLTLERSQCGNLHSYWRFLAWSRRTALGAAFGKGAREVESPVFQGVFERQFDLRRVERRLGRAAICRRFTTEQEFSDALAQAT